ncbi:integral membrane protein, partial [Candidatus Thiomargarita nelsonii]
MIESYTHWVIRWRYLVILVILALVFWAGSGVRFLQFKNDHRMYFGKENPQLIAFESLQNTYAKDDNVLFVVAPKDGRVFTPEVLASVEKLTNAAWQIPYVRRVDSITNFQHSWAEGDHLRIDDLVRNAADLTTENLQRIQEIALNEPLLVNSLISPMGHVTGINVTVQPPGINQNTEVPEVTDFARRLAKEMLSENPNLEIYLTGALMMDITFTEASVQDITTLIPIMFLVLLIILGLLLHTFSGIIVTLLIIFLSIIPAMGLAGWLGIDLSPSSSIAPNIIMI